MGSSAPVDRIIGTLETACAAVLPSIPMVIKGVPTPSLDGKEEWVQFDFLSESGIPSHAQQIENTIYFQIMCFSRYAHLRVDNNYRRPWAMSELYKAAFKNQLFKVPTGAGAEISCIRVFEPKQIYLDLPSSGEFSKQIYLQSVQLDTHCVLLLFEGQQIDTLIS